MNKLKPLNVLIVEDSENDVILIVRRLRAGGYDVKYERVETAEDMLAALEKQTWDVVISDYTMPRFSGPAALDIIRRGSKELPFIIISGTIGEELAVSALKRGANDYIMKDNLSRLVSAVERELQGVRERHSLKLSEGEKKKLDEQLRQLQKMETLGLLAGGIAHEFNNRLAAIINFGYLAKTALKEDAPAGTTSGYIEQMLASAEAATGLTQSLLAFSRKEVLSSSKPVKVNEIIKNTHKLLHRLIREDIKLEVNAGPLNLTVMADPAQIENALLNLATNSRDAMPNGGRLSINVEAVTLDEDFIRAHGFGKPGPYALLSVVDTGIGMDEKTRQQIFEPFFTTKGVGKGTGLGLPIVYTIIKQHDGYITCYSEPGIGTTFGIYLPLTEQKAKVTKQRAASGSTFGKGKTVLLAEDDPALREGTRTLLMMAGYKVIEAENGEEAVKKFKDALDEIDIVVLDVIMPHLNGRYAYEGMRRLKPGVKALFLSGYSAGFISKDLLSEGVEHMSKPVLPAEFLEKLKEIILGGTE